MATGMGQFLNAIKRTEKRDYATTEATQNGVTPFGMYGMLVENWEQWSSMAGIGGADRLDPAAQDYVAGHMADRLFRRYGSWDLVGAAWYAGAQAADAAAQSGLNVKFFKTEEVQQWLGEFQENFEASAGAPVPHAAAAWINPAGAPKGWLMPVAGDNEWSRGSWMPNTHNHRGRTHAAIDLYAKTGTPIVAPVGGKVLKVGVGGELGGNTVTVLGDDGLTYYFAHMSDRAVVNVGQKVKPGAHLGFVGNTGSARTTKPHLHFSIKRNGVPVNPSTYLEGSKNAGNYYAPDHAAHEVQQRPKPSQKLSALLQSVSNNVAGGQRIDYRTAGNEEQEVMT